MHYTFFSPLRQLLRPPVLTPSWLKWLLVIDDYFACGVAS